MAPTRTVKVDPAELRVPAVAWPTVVLFVAAIAGWAAGAAAGLAWGWPLAATLPLQVAAAFAVFTPMHDAAHGSAARSARWLNAGMGRVAGVILGAPYIAFRYVHLEHHKHTNDPERDPDYWSGRGPALLQPLRWVSQVRPHTLTHTCTHMHTRTVVGRGQGH
jgi:beta-carotene hydroxylase